MSIIGIDNEVSALTAEEGKQEIHIHTRDVCHRDKVQCARAVHVPLVERQHVGHFTRDLETSFPEFHQKWHLHAVGVRHPRNEVQTCVVGDEHARGLSRTRTRYRSALKAHDSHTLTVFTATPRGVLHVAEMHAGLADSCEQQIMQLFFRQGNWWKLTLESKRAFRNFHPTPESACFSVP